MNGLVDTFGRKHTYLRISVTDRCNLRCRYCMPGHGIVWKSRDEILSFEEIRRIAGVFVQMGIEKVRITGGEPLVRKDLAKLMKMLGELRSGSNEKNGTGIHTLAMTTNATLLADKCPALKKAGLNALNISLDSLRKERFKDITRRDDFDSVMEGIEAALYANFDSLKLNVVVIKGFNEDEVMDFVDFARDRRINVRFIEYMPFPDNQWSANGVFSYAEMKAVIGNYYTLVPVNNDPCEVARDFAIDGHTGTISFITSMTDSFCSTCNRLRLTADGFIKSCLFYDGEINLRDALRSGATDGEIAGLIRTAVIMKPEAHPPAEELQTQSNRTMIEIGG